MNKKMLSFLLIITFFLLSSSVVVGEEKGADIPNHVFTIDKENTFPNKTENIEEIEANDSTIDLFETTDIQITNPTLIQMLNETSISPSPIGFGYRGQIFLGRWPLHYESTDTNINWEYQEINTNELNNGGGDVEQMLRYHQTERREIHGVLTNKISHTEHIRLMILQAAKEQTNLPLTYHTVIGEQTTAGNTYNVGAEQFGVLHTYASAVNEKGKATFGDVYIQLKGTKKMLVIKNITKQGIGAWLPIENYVSFSYQVK